MPKIKDIHDRLLKNPVEYTEIRLTVAKRVLGFFMAFYYLSFLFTMGGFSFGPFSLTVLSQITFHAYTILVIIIAWFFYEFIVYVVHLYFPERQIFIIGGLVMAVIFTLLALYTHFI
jgi:hypothetical protein